MNTSRKNLIIFIIIVAVLVVLGIWVGMNLGNKSGSSGFSAVYLTSGDIYFGKFSWFPTPHVTDAWYLQRGTDAQGKPTVNVAPFKTVPWSPANTIYISGKQIVMWSEINPDSQFAKALANPDAAQPGQIPVPTTNTPSGR